MLKRIYQHFFLIATVVFAVLGFIHLRRLTGDAPKVADIAGLFVCTSLFGFVAISGYMEDLERKLNKWMEAKTGGTSSGSVNAIEPYRQRSQRTEAEIVALGLTAPRVTAELIQVLIDGLTWRYEHHESPQIIFAHAFIGDFYLATGFSKPVSAENFSPALGMKYAREQAEGKARDKLWELEGYKLMCQLKGEQA